MAKRGSRGQGYSAMGCEVFVYQEVMLDMGQHQEEFLISLLVALGLGIACGLALPGLPFVPLVIVLIGLLVWAAWGSCLGSKQV